MDTAPPADASGPRRPRTWSDPGAARLFRVSIVSLVALIAAAPWIARTAIGVLAVDATSPIDWVPATFPARRAYARVHGGV